MRQSLPKLPLSGLALGLLLAACGTVQDQCIRLATPEIQPLNRKIAAVEATLQRGYALDEVEVREWRWVVCGPGQPGAPGQPPGPPEMCFEEVPRIEIRRREVDLAAERRALAALQSDRRRMEATAAPAIAACKAKYPQ